MDMDLSSFFREIVRILGRRLPWTVAFALCFFIGILSGIVIDKPSSVEYYYLDYCDVYVYRIFSGSAWGIFLDRTMNGALFLLPSVLLAVSVFFVPLQGLLVFYKGFVFGSVTVILFSVYRFSGFAIWLIVLLPQVLLFAAVHVALSVIAFDCGCENRGGNVVRKLKEFAVWLLAAAAAALLCAVMEFLSVCLVFRPVARIL